MEENKRERKKFDKEFITAAVKLVVEGGKDVTKTAEDLGIDKSLLYRWKREYLTDKENAFPGKGHLKPLEEENRRLKKELYDVTEERDILKKAIAIFSKHKK